MIAIFGAIAIELIDDWDKRWNSQMMRILLPVDILRDEDDRWYIYSSDLRSLTNRIALKSILLISASAWSSNQNFLWILVSWPSRVLHPNELVKLTRFRSYSSCLLSLIPVDFSRNRLTAKDGRTKQHRSRVTYTQFQSAAKEGLAAEGDA